MNTSVELSVVVTTILALGSATGAALCCVLGFMQWKSGALSGGEKYLVWLWLIAFSCNAGGVSAAILGLAGFPGESQTIAIASLAAWGPTSVAPALILRAVDREIPSSSIGRRVLLGASVVVTSAVLAMMISSVFVPRFPLTFVSANYYSFISAMLHAGTCGAISFVHRRRLRSEGRRVRPAHWLLPFAVTLIGLNFLAGMIFFYAPARFDALRAVALVAVMQQIIPWAIAAAAFQAESLYADVVLKRSLTLVASILIAAGLASSIPSIPWGLPTVWTSLLVASLILVAPVFHRCLSRFVDRVLLKRPEYSLLTQAFADAARRTVNQDELFGLARKSIEDALHVKAYFIPAAEAPAPKYAPVRPNPVKDAAGVEYVIELVPSTQGRTLMQEEFAFLNAISSETVRRLESLGFEHERHELRSREERLRHSATEAELKALRAQVDPHFLFNTLNTIAELITSEPSKAELMTEKLAEFFRYTLARQNRTVSTLDDELAFARHYLDIEQVRFGDRLRVEISRDGELGEERVPSLILQPLVENAVRHGLASKLGGGTVSILAKSEGVLLCLQVIDDGVGFRDNDNAAAGVGLRNVRERLCVLYGDAAEMILGAGPQNRGTCVTLRLPK